MRKYAGGEAGRMPPKTGPTTGIPELDRLVGGILAGDNVVLEADSGAPVDRIVSSFISACGKEGRSLTYISFNRSPQTISESYTRLMPPGCFHLLDCFSAGKGGSDEVFMSFYRSGTGEREGVIRVEKPRDPSELMEQLAAITSGADPSSRYVFDSITGMTELWQDEEEVLRFFGRTCPRLYDLNTIAVWLLEREAHSERALAKVQHVTQVALEIGIPQGRPMLIVRKAANRSCPVIGIPQPLRLDGSGVSVEPVSREDRELGLLTALGETLGSALEPGAFFERTLGVLESQLGMLRCTLVLLDRATNKLRIAAARGLTHDERLRGEYSPGEGITGQVASTGRPEVVPDISKDPRFLDRTSARRREDAGTQAMAFICVPLRVDDEVVGTLSVDRPFATPDILEKDLRLLTIVASTVSQVLKINRMVHVEKEQILAYDRKNLDELRSKYRLEKVAGQSKPMRKVLATAATAAKSDAPVLITGETGTGKELIAGVVHYNSARATGPLITVNCGALSEELLESELFGHVRGAFTGAVRDRKGRFELANGGTLFLDEVADMSPRLQVKLLRVVQSLEFEPVGSDETVRVSVRIVAATNRDLPGEIRAGRFRLDLFYRLNVIPIHIPPLRERREDILPLVDHFLEAFNRANSKKVGRLSREVLDLLLKYPWPGNVRELENAMERAVVMSPGEILAPDLLPAEITGYESGMGREDQGPGLDGDGLAGLIQREVARSAEPGEAMNRLVGAVESAVLQRAVSSGMNQRELAKKLGMSRMTLRKKLREYRIAS